MVYLFGRYNLNSNVNMSIRLQELALLYNKLLLLSANQLQCVL